MSPVSKHQKFLLGTLALGHLTNDWVAGTLWLIAPAIAASMGLGPAEVGLILTINGVGAGLAYIPAGIISDRSSRPGLLMLISFWWVAIGYYSATLAPGFWGVTLLLAFGVMGDAFWHPVATGVLVKEMPDRRAQVLGIHAVGGSIGAEVLGPLATGFLLGFFDWRTSLQILVIPAVLMGILFFPIARRITAGNESKLARIDFKGLFRHWSSAPGMALIGIMVFYNMSLIAILAMTPLYLQSGYGVSPFQVGVIIAGMLLTGTLFQPFFGQYTDRRGRKTVIVTMLLCSSVFAFAAGFNSQLVWVVAALLPAAALLTAVRPVVLATAVEFSARSEATTLGIVFTVLDGVGMFGALLGGIVGEFELHYAYYLSAVLAMLAAAICVFLKFNFSPAHAVEIELC